MIPKQIKMTAKKKEKREQINKIKEKTATHTHTHILYEYKRENVQHNYSSLDITNRSIFGFQIYWNIDWFDGVSFVFQGVLCFYYYDFVCFFSSVSNPAHLECVLSIHDINERTPNTVCALCHDAHQSNPFLLHRINDIYI